MRAIVTGMVACHAIVGRSWSIDPYSGWPTFWAIIDAIYIIFRIHFPPDIGSTKMRQN